MLSRSESVRMNEGKGMGVRMGVGLFDITNRVAMLTLKRAEENLITLQMHAHTLPGSLRTPQESRPPGHHQEHALIAAWPSHVINCTTGLHLIAGGSQEKVTKKPLAVGLAWA